MAKISLLGALGEKFGKEFNIQISTPAEAIAAIACQTPGFTAYLNESTDEGVGYQVITASYPEGMDQDELQYPLEDEEIIIAPVIAGAGGAGKVILGVGLVAAAFVTGGISVLGLALSSTTLGLMGAALILSGVSQLLTSTPAQGKDTTKDTSSSIVDRIAGVSSQGSPVPLIYGQMMVNDPIILSTATTEETSAGSLTDAIESPLYKRTTQVKLAYKAKASQNYQYHYSSKTYRSMNLDYLSNNDNATGTVINKSPYNSLMFEVSFSSTPSGLNIASAYPIQRVRLFTGMDGYYGATRLEIYRGNAATGYVGLASWALTPNTWIDYDLSASAAFNVASPYFTFIFYQDTDGVDYIAVGELELYGSVGLSESLANIKS